MKETDIYREFPPPPHLRDSIACFWVRRGDAGTVRVLPDACSDLVWRAGEDAVVAGPDSGPSFSRTRASELIVGARFLPGAGGPALGLPLHEIRDRRVPVSELGLDLPEPLTADLEPREAFRAMSSVAIRMATLGSPDHAVQTAAVSLLDPAQRIDRLAAELGLSERQLRRRFRAAVGYGPKTLQRVLRLRRFLHGSPTDLARAALEAGYSDQAHLTRECRHLTGLSPAVLTRPGPTHLATTGAIERRPRGYLAQPTRERWRSARFGALIRDTALQPARVGGIG